MAENILPDHILTLLREQGIIKQEEIAVQEGDLTVAVDVITGLRRLIENLPLKESKNKRLLKG